MNKNTPVIWCNISLEVEPKSLTLHLRQHFQLIGELVLKVVLYLEEFVIFVHLDSDRFHQTNSLIF